MIPTYTTPVGLPKICLAFDWPTKMKITRTAPNVLKLRQTATVKAIVNDMQHRLSPTTATLDNDCKASQDSHFINSYLSVNFQMSHKQVCHFSLLSGRNVRWTRRVLPPGESQWVCRRDRQTERRQKRKGKEEYLYSALYILCISQSAQAWITQFYLQIHHACLYFVSVHQMAPPLTEVRDIQLQLTTHLSTLKGWTAELAGWLTYSGRFTHISDHPSATGRAQNRESSPAEDRRSTTVPRNQTVTLRSS